MQSVLKSGDIIVNEGQVINRTKVFTRFQMPPLRTSVSGGQSWLRSRRLSPAVRPHRHTHTQAVCVCVCQPVFSALSLS